MSKTMKCPYCFALIEADDDYEHFQFHEDRGDIELNTCEHGHAYRSCPYGYKDVACDGQQYTEHLPYKVVGRE